VTKELGTKAAGTNSPEFKINLIFVFRANNTVPNRHHGEITPGKDVSTNTKLNKTKGNYYIREKVKHGFHTVG